MHPDHGDDPALPKKWCKHIKLYIHDGEEAVILHPNHHIQVPIFPTADVFGEVWIGEDIGNGAALMSLNFTPDIGRPYSVKLGFWNPGEGMVSIREVILDYIRSRTHPYEDFVSDKFSIKTKCPSSVHGIRESRIIEENSVRSMKWRWQCIWNIVMEKACTPCMERSSGGTDDNFGIDASVIPKPRWS